MSAEAAAGDHVKSARANLDFRGFVDPASNMTGAAGRQGVELQYESNGSGDASARGTWAVTCKAPSRLSVGVRTTYRWSSSLSEGWFGSALGKR